MICIDKLVRKALDGSLTDKTEVLYISPLKALGNDIQKNLEGPLGEIMQLASERGFLMPEIRTFVRSGDTPATALTAFAQIAPRQAKVVELRYFGGLNEGEIVEVLKVSPRTVQRDWEFARVWLARELHSGRPTTPQP